MKLFSWPSSILSWSAENDLIYKECSWLRELLFVIIFTRSSIRAIRRPRLFLKTPCLLKSSPSHYFIYVYIYVQSPSFDEMFDIPVISYLCRTWAHTLIKRVGWSRPFLKTLFVSLKEELFVKAKDYLDFSVIKVLFLWQKNIFKILK